MTSETNRTDRDEYWMTMALEEAGKAADEGEVPIGAVAILGDQLIARDHNRSIQQRDPTAHAEILVLRAAGQQIDNYRLNGIELYVTVEPCPMCAGALIWARVSRLIYGTRDEKSGVVESKVGLLAPGLFNHEVQIVEDVLAKPCREILQRFFEAKRTRA